MEHAHELSPFFPPDADHRLADQAAELLSSSGRLFGQVAPGTQEGMQDLVRAMNCYYSNLIEGEHTYPADIERALRQDFAMDLRQRNLQKLAAAHVRVQERIDRGEAPTPAVSQEFLFWAHKEIFAAQEGPIILKGRTPGWENVVVPGAFRRFDVGVGGHNAPRWQHLPELMAAFVRGYADEGLSRIQRVLGIAAAHHRFVWIHPFGDGNGRGVRILTDAMCRESGLHGGLWSVSRGLARTQADYRDYLREADEFAVAGDGEGHLSAKGLAAFCRYFLRVAEDQVQFMGRMFEPAGLERRIARYCAGREELSPRHPDALLRGSGTMLTIVARYGHVPRGELQEAIGASRPWASTVMRRLLTEGLLVSGARSGPVRLGFPAKVWEDWFPTLYLGPSAGLVHDALNRGPKLER